MDLDKAIEKRRSIRRFKETKKPDYRDIINAIQAATKAPLAGNISSIKYILVSDKEKIKQLATAAQQRFVSQVSYVVVVCTDKKTLVKNYYERGERYARQQAGAAIENFLLKLMDFDLDSCWTGAFDDNAVKRILKIPEDIDVEAMLPIGIAFEKPKPRRDPDLDKILWYDVWKQKEMVPQRKFDT